MPAVTDDADPAHQQVARQKLCEAMERDIAGQQELIATRARGETDAVFWEGNQPPQEPPASPDQNLVE